ncbi:MAG: alpha/beta hydrolase, partial [Synergistaceae bacterium]|nr:alpha/beta hydrolase [Synergistaceae bacterium]
MMNLLCVLMPAIMLGLAGCSSGGAETMRAERVTEATKIADVVNNPAFGDYGRMIFPLNEYYYSGDTLGTLRLTWYSYINPSRTVDVINYMLDEVHEGRKIFYPIYPDDDPRAKSTGLFFFRGNRGAKFAVCNAGGGFVYVGAIHDSFPHALELSRRGYNAFALIYRPGYETACEDLARAIAFIHDNAAELGVDAEGYSLWGGSAGARMSAWLGAYGTESFGEKSYPRPSAVIMQYTGLNDVTGNEPPTYACVGTSDRIASYRSMRSYVDRIKANGTDAMIEIFTGLPHGFGLGEGTIAEGWLNNAVKFWESC